jgi:hypothetical protein
MYRHLIKKTSYLILIEWPKEISDDDDNVGRFKGQKYILYTILRHL